MSTFTIRAQTFTAPTLEPALYIVATPIGNLGDITLRALDVLAGADVIACEDTRTTGVLLSRYGIGTDKVSYTEHNADTRGADLLRQIGEGRAVALVSDAGTPLVSDPGARLVAAAVDAGVVVVPIPGAAAPVSALVGQRLVRRRLPLLRFSSLQGQGPRRPSRRTFHRRCDIGVLRKPGAYCQ